MKRDWQLIKALLEYLEQALTPQNIDQGIFVPCPDALGAKCTKEEIVYHLNLCEEAGYITLSTSHGVPRVKALTWNGHNKLDEFRGSNLHK